jgi:hypothetical protein
MKDRRLSRAAHNNSFNPTRLSLAFINVVALRLACVASPAGGLIRAFGGCASKRS